MEHNEDLMTAAMDDVTGGEEWLRLAGSAADARQRGARMRRTRMAGIGGAAAAVVAVAAVTATTFSGGSGPRSVSVAGGATQTTATVPVPVPAPPKPGTLGAEWEKAQSCPESLFGAASTADKNEAAIRAMYIARCQNAMRDLPHLLPDVSVYPLVSWSKAPLKSPLIFDDPSTVVPAGVQLYHQDAVYIVTDGKKVQHLFINASLTDTAGRPADGPGVTDVSYAGGITGRLQVDPDSAHGPAYYLWFQNAAKVTGFIELQAHRGDQPLFDIAALAHDPGIGSFLASLLDGTVDTRAFV